MRKFLLACVLAVVAAGCTSPGGTTSCRDCGTVRAVDVINTGEGRTTGAGAIIGAVIGGVVGHQIGSGRGNAAATAGGAVAGAVVGNEAEKSRGVPVSYYRITVDMDSGVTREVNVNDTGGLARGSRVRVIGRDLEVIRS
jgi:outer membrane lipoprotein SlyB